MKDFSSEGKDEEILTQMLRDALMRQRPQASRPFFSSTAGFHRVHLCRSCGKPVPAPTVKCPLPTSEGERLACHYCGFHCPPQTLCRRAAEEPRSYGFGRTIGNGTEVSVPRLRLARMDRTASGGRATLLSPEKVQPRESTCSWEPDGHQGV